jgi:hypothetical protein
MPSMSREREAASLGCGQGKSLVCNRCGLSPHPGCMSGWLASGRRVRRLDCPHAAIAYVLEEPA